MSPSAKVENKTLLSTKNTQYHLLNLGFGNLVLAGRVVAVVNPNSSPMRRLREDARQDGRLIDATQGRKTRSIVITDSNHVILSAVQPDTMRQRFAAENELHGQQENGAG